MAGVVSEPVHDGHLWKSEVRSVLTAVTAYKHPLADPINCVLTLNYQIVFPNMIV